MTIPTPIMINKVMSDIRPTRTPLTLAARFGGSRIEHHNARELHAEAIAIWEECRARGEMLPHGNDLQCLLIIHRIAMQMRNYGIDVPDFLFLSVSEYEEAIANGGRLG